MSGQKGPMIFCVKYDLYFPQTRGQIKSVKDKKEVRCDKVTGFERQPQQPRGH